MSAEIVQSWVRILVVRIANMGLNYTNKHRKRIKLIFNPASGMAKKSSQLLMDILKELQICRFVPELFITEPDTDYAGMVSDSLAEGIRMFIVCGGDGTVSSVAKAVLGTNAVLGIIPTGTQNNVAFSLGIPDDIRSAINLLRAGKIIKTDVGIATCGKVTVPFLEICSVGLFSALFKSGDDIQHGDIAKIGNFLATLTASTPSKISLLLDDKFEIKDVGHVVLVSNMPYIGRRFQVGSEGSYRDGLLDVIFCTDIPKLDLMVGYMLRLPGLNAAEDSRIKRFQVKKAVIETSPEMPVMADGIELNRGSVKIEIVRRALAIMAGSAQESRQKG